MSRSPLSPETIEKIRRGFPLELDAMGRLIFEGDEITHPRVVDFFREAFDLSDEGEPIVAFEGQWTYLNPRDCVFRVLGVDGEPPARPQLRLDDGRQLELDPASLRDEGEAGLRCELPARQSGRPLSARFSNKAAMQLSDWLSLDETGSWYEDGAGRVSIGPAPGS